MSMTEKLKHILHGLRDDRETVVRTRNPADMPLLLHYNWQIASVLARLQQERCIA